MVNTLCVIQARMGSSRLPGKVMLPLDCNHVIEHDIRRVASAESVDDVVVATSDEKQDDILTRYAERTQADVYRGSEDDVLGRMHGAASQRDADVIVRVTADCPLVSPEVIDHIVTEIYENELDRAFGSSGFPLGIAVEAFTFESFTDVMRMSTEDYQREHVTPYYKENSGEFDMAAVDPSDVFSENWLAGREDFRLTLDEADDYKLFRQVYENVSYDNIVDIRDAVEYIDNNELYRINEHVDQKGIHD